MFHMRTTHELLLSVVYFIVTGVDLMVCYSACDTNRSYNRIFSTRTAYEEVRGKQVKVQEIPGCEVSTIYSLNRHGTRFPGEDEVVAINTFLPTIRDQIVANTRRGELCMNQVLSLKFWKPTMKPADGLENTEGGLLEIRDIGTRWRMRFPKFFSENVEFDMKCTDYNRVRKAAQYLYMGLTATTGHGECGSVPTEEDTLLLYLDSCAKYISTRLAEDDMEKLEAHKFIHSLSVQDMLDDLTLRLGLRQNSVNLTVAIAMYEACRFEHAIYQYAPWCEALSNEMLNMMVYAQDMKYYWRYGHGREINYEPSCLLLKDIVNSLVDAQKKPEDKSKTLTLRVGNSRTLLPLLVRLGLFRDEKPLMADNYKHHRRRQWQLGKVNPFASNLVFVLFNCGDEYKVRTYLNEKLIVLPGCARSLCPLSSLLDRWTETLSSCDFQKLCRDNDIDVKAFNYDMHHL